MKNNLKNLLYVVFSVTVMALAISSFLLFLWFVGNSVWVILSTFYQGGTNWWTLLTSLVGFNVLLMVIFNHILKFMNTRVKAEKRTANE